MRRINLLRLTVTQIRVRNKLGVASSLYLHLSASFCPWRTWTAWRWSQRGRTVTNRPQHDQKMHWSVQLKYSPDAALIGLRFVSGVCLSVECRCCCLVAEAIRQSESRGKRRRQRGLARLIKRNRSGNLCYSGNAVELIQNEWQMNILPSRLEALVVRKIFMRQSRRVERKKGGFAI